MPELKAIIIRPGSQKLFKESAHRLGVEKNIMFMGLLDEEIKTGALDASIALVLLSVSNYGRSIFTRCLRSLGQTKARNSFSYW